MKNEKLQMVIELNHLTQKKAKELNIRAGQEVFKIMSKSDWSEWLSSRLNGVYCISEIEDFDSLLLEELDPEKVSEICRNNPDSIEVEGNILKMEYGKTWYSDGYYVRTIVEDSFVRNVKLDSITLPGGRIVELQCNGFCMKSFGALIEKLDSKYIEECWSKKRNELEYSSWIKNPEEVFPYFSKLLTRVEVVNLGNERIIYAYYSLYSDSDPDFQIRLRGSYEEAQKETELGLIRLFQKTSKDFVVIPNEEPWKIKSSSYSSSWNITDLGTGLQNKISELFSENNNQLNVENFENRLEDLKSKIFNIKQQISYEYVGVKKILEDTEACFNEELENISNKDAFNSEIETISELIKTSKSKLSTGYYADVDVLCQSVNEAVFNIKVLRQELEERIKEGEILFNFEIWHRRGGVGNCGDGWVITPEGFLRDPDKKRVPQYKSDGYYVWNLVSKEELAISWECGSTRDVAGTSNFNVVKMPVSGVTEQQLQAVRKIEIEIDTIENSFGLDPEVGKIQEEFINQLSQVFPRCPVCEEELQYDRSSFKKLSSENGICICRNSREIFNFLNLNQSFDQRIEGRDAQVIYSIRLFDGVIEVLAYDKYGQWNANARFRKISEEELNFFEEKKSTVDVSQIDLSDLFGGANVTKRGGRK